MAIVARTALASTFAAALLAGALLASQRSTSAPASAPKPRFADPSRVGSLKTQIRRLRRLAKPLPDPKPGDWLYLNKEAGQTFDQYLAAKPTVPTKRRCRIYVQPLGRLNTRQRSIVTLAARFLGVYYGLDVEVPPPLSLSQHSAERRRCQAPAGWRLEAVARDQGQLR